MRNKGSLTKWFSLLLTVLISATAFSQGVPSAPHKASGYTVAEVQAMHQTGNLSCDRAVFTEKVVEILQRSADQQGMKYADGSPVNFSSSTPGIMDSIFRYTVVKDEFLTKAQFMNYSWENGKFIPVPRDLNAGEKGLYFDPNLSPYFDTKYEPIRYASDWCVNPQEKLVYSRAITSGGRVDNGNGSTTEIVKVPAGEDGEDIYIFNYNTNTNTNTNTTTPAAIAPPPAMMPTQGYTQGSQYSVYDGMYYPQGNSQGGWVENNKGQMVWTDWANLFLNVADLAVDIWTLWKLYDMAGTPETVIPPSVYNYYTTNNYNIDKSKDIVINNGNGDDDGPDLPDNGDGDDGPDLPDNGPDLPGNGSGRLASQNGKTVNPFSGGRIDGEGFKTKPTTNAVTVNKGGNVFGGSALAVSPKIEANKNISAGSFSGGVSTPSTGINKQNIFNSSGAVSSGPLMASNNTNPFGGAQTVLSGENLSVTKTGGITGIKNPNSISNTGQTSPVVMTSKNVTGGQVVSGAIVANEGFISGSKVTGIKPVQVTQSKGTLGGGVKPAMSQQSKPIKVQGQKIIAGKQQITTPNINRVNTRSPVINNFSGNKIKSAGLGAGGLKSR